MIDGTHSGGPALVGQTLDGRFAVEALIGSGGWGQVYRALQLSVRRPVALKVLRADISREAVTRFLREARATSSLRNVHTVTTYDFGQDPRGILYLAMELLEGEPLSDRLARVGAFDWPHAARIAAEAAESLAEAHEKGIVHRDLKPANIFLTSMGGSADFVKVLDFGIAKLQTEGMQAAITSSGALLGTPSYMSPEQCRGERVDLRSDLYSLGIVLYEMLVGRPPFVAEHPIGLLLKHCQEPVAEPTMLRPGLQLPDGLRALLLALLAKDPASRPPSAGAVRAQLRPLLDAAVRAGRPTAAPRAPAPLPGAGGPGPTGPLPNVPAAERAGSAGSAPRAAPGVPPPIPGALDTPGAEPAAGPVTPPRRPPPAVTLAAPARDSRPAGPARSTRPRRARRRSWALGIAGLALLGAALAFGLRQTAPPAPAPAPMAAAAPAETVAPRDRGTAAPSAPAAPSMAVAPSSAAPAAAPAAAAAAPAPAAGADAAASLPCSLCDAAGPAAAEATGPAMAAGQDALVRLTSTPAGAEVWLGGRRLGKTPLSVRRPAAPLRFELRLRGHVARQVTLTPAEPAERNVTLQRVSAPRRPDSASPPAAAPAAPGEDLLTY